MCGYIEYKCDSSLFAYGSWRAFQPDRGLPDAMALLPSVRIQLARGQTFGIGAVLNLLQTQPALPFLWGLIENVCVYRIET
jgi:hypothetical protein